MHEMTNAQLRFFTSYAANACLLGKERLLAQRDCAEAGKAGKMGKAGEAGEAGAAEEATTSDL